MPSPFKFRRGEQLTTLLEITAVCSLFRSTQGQDFVNVPQSAIATSAYPLDSRDFRAWMLTRFEAATGLPPSAHALSAALQTLRARARFGQTGEAAVGPRLVAGNNSILLDLADAESRCIEISGKGWVPADGVHLAFERGPHTGQLPMPVTAAEPGVLESLRCLLNIAAGPAWTRTLIWLTAALRPEGPYPILILRGASGTGKSTTARMLRSLLDPVRKPLGPLPSTPHQMELAVCGARILACDDVDRIPKALRGPLAQIADQTAPVILVLSSQFAGELPENIACRSLTVELSEPRQVRTLFSLRKLFEALQPQVLGTFCSAASQALARFEQFAEGNFTRLADTTAWTLAAAPTLRVTEEDIREAIFEQPAAQQALAQTALRPLKLKTKNCPLPAHLAPLDTGSNPDFVPRSASYRDLLPGE